MKISMENLVVGQEYSRPQLAKIWGYDGYQALGMGIFTPGGDNKIVLFITDKIQKALTNYKNTFDGTTLQIEGETSHRNDNRLLGTLDSDDEIFLFYRNESHSDFVYHGQVFLTDYEIIDPEPSKFVFSVSVSSGITSIETEEITHGIASDEFVPDEEGKKKVQLHVQYERSKKNRLKALQIHGVKCKACGFDFNDFYGKEIAKDYIEIHHTKLLSLKPGVVDPKTDLIPLCSNCHSMIHRNHPNLMSVAELRAHLKKDDC